MLDLYLVCGALNSARHIAYNLSPIDHNPSIYEEQGESSYTKRKRKTLSSASICPMYPSLAFEIALQELGSYEVSSRQCIWIHCQPVNRFCFPVNMGSKNGPSNEFGLFLLVFALVAPNVVFSPVDRMVWVYKKYIYQYTNPIKSSIPQHSTQMHPLVKALPSNQFTARGIYSYIRSKIETTWLSLNRSPPRSAWMAYVNRSCEAKRAQNAPYSMPPRQARKIGTEHQLQRAFGPPCHSAQRLLLLPLPRATGHHVTATQPPAKPKTTSHAELSIKHPKQPILDDNPGFVRAIALGI